MHPHTASPPTQPILGRHAVVADVADDPESRASIAPGLWKSVHDLGGA